MFTRLRKSEGFGMIELLMALTVLNVGILAIVAAFNTGIVAIRRSSEVSTASALADQQMELYRGLQYDSIALNATTIASAEAPYSTDAAFSDTQVDTCMSTTAPECMATRTVDADSSPPSPDRKSYRVDTYIQMSTASTTPPTPAGGRAVKIVTVVVRNGAALTASPLARVISTFDALTG